MPHRLLWLLPLFAICAFSSGRPTAVRGAGTTFMVWRTGEVEACYTIRIQRPGRDAEPAVSDRATPAAKFKRACSRSIRLRAGHRSDPAAYWSRRTRFNALPVALRGIRSMNRTAVGILKRAILPLQ